jgi:hypothetical protein
VAGGELAGGELAGGELAGGELAGGELAGGWLALASWRGPADQEHPIFAVFAVSFYWLLAGPFSPAGVVITKIYV